MHKTSNPIRLRLPPRLDRSVHNLVGNMLSFHPNGISRPCSLFCISFSRSSKPGTFLVNEEFLETCHVRSEILTNDARRQPLGSKREGVCVVSEKYSSCYYYFVVCFRLFSMSAGKRKQQEQAFLEGANESTLPLNFSRKYGNTVNIQDGAWLTLPLLLPTAWLSYVYFSTNKLRSKVCCGPPSLAHFLFLCASREIISGKLYNMQPFLGGSIERNEI